MDEWAAFVTARLDEYEAAAKAAQAPSPWKAAGHESDSWIVTDATGEPLIYDEGTPSLEEAAHIARHDPGRTLRRIKGARMILARYEDCLARMEDPDYPAGVARDQAREYEDFVFPELAAEWSDHPDYPDRSE